jgi:hypothetical protein
MDVGVGFVDRAADVGAVFRRVFVFWKRNQSVRVKLGVQNIFLELNNNSENGYYT